MTELLLQASMGLSHIYHDIRVDACRLISLLLAIAPTHVVGAWPRTQGASENRILDGLRLVAGIGGRAGEGGQNGLNLLPGSKRVILETLLAFVKAGLRKQGLLTGSGRDGRAAAAAAAQDLQVPLEIFEPFQARYPVVDRLASAARYDKGKGREVLPLSRLSDAAVQEKGQLFEGWLVTQWDQTVCDAGDDALWTLSSIGQRGEEAGDENIGQALSVRAAISPVRLA